MRYLVALIVVTLLVFFLRSAIKKAPSVFYILSLVVGIVYLYNQTIHLPSQISSFIALLTRQSALAMMFFIVVMFAGVFSDASKVKKWLMPVRKELSIIGCILTAPHVIIYLVAFLPRILPNSPFPFLPFDYFRFVVSLLLLIIILILGVTSFEIVRHRMTGQSWKRIQWLAYLLLIILAIHVMTYLLPAALGGGTHAVESVAFYSCITVIYIVLRALRWRLDLKRQDKLLNNS